MRRPGDGAAVHSRLDDLVELGIGGAGKEGVGCLQVLPEAEGDLGVSVLEFLGSPECLESGGSGDGNSVSK